jgi:hypothetical protein
MFTPVSPKPIKYFRNSSADHTNTLHRPLGEIISLFLLLKKEGGLKCFSVS